MAIVIDLGGGNDTITFQPLPFMLTEASASLTVLGKAGNDTVTFNRFSNNIRESLTSEKFFVFDGGADIDAVHVNGTIALSEHFVANAESFDSSGEDIFADIVGISTEGDPAAPGGNITLGNIGASDAMELRTSSVGDIVAGDIEVKGGDGDFLSVTRNSTFHRLDAGGNATVTASGDANFNGVVQVHGK